MFGDSAIGEVEKFVIATVVAPLALACSSMSTVSVERPLCESAIATSPGPSCAALMSPACTSDQVHEAMPIRCIRICMSSSTAALWPTP